MVTPEQRREELDAAVGHLYEVFERYRFRGRMEACPCCFTEDHHRFFETHSFREMTAANLANYVQHVGTVGDAFDYRHFLPRILELTVDGADEIWTLTGPFGGMEHHRWREWPAAEQEAVRRLVRAWWPAFLDSPGEDPLAEEVLCCLAMVMGDIRPQLDHWRERFDAQALQHLSQFVSYNFTNLAQRQFTSGWPWEDLRGPAADIEAWITDRAALDHLELGFFQHADAPVAANLSLAIQYLELIAATRRSASANDPPPPAPAV